MTSDVVVAIIVAAGAGSRMGKGDKIFSPLGGRPLLARTIAAFQDCASISRIVLVLRPENYDHGMQLVSDYGMSKVVACLGGARRQDSVRCGLDSAGRCDWVIIHDGARPLVTVDLLKRGLDVVRDSGAAVAAIPVVDTIKEVDAEGSIRRTLDRSALWSIQTPQLFRYSLVRKAHDEITTDVTDDAAMIEALNFPVTVFAGSRFNLKVTTPEDLSLAEMFLSNQVVIPNE